jgi:simple sugar transport system ATP-binding protein
MPEQLGSELIRAENICKGFPGVWKHLVLDHINFDVKSGEIHALLGENGAGKTVLANIISGFYSLSEGKIYVKGKLTSIKTPRQALDLGIGMVHQEFNLIRRLTVAKNVALGIAGSNFSYPLPEIEKRIKELSEKYGLKVDPKAKIENLSTGEQQRVEILKVIYHEPQLLILDEPTSVLTTDECKNLFSILRAMKKEGRGVMFITHRFQEVLDVSDRVTVLRLGKMVGMRKTKETNEQELAKMMVGNVITPLKRARGKPGKVALEVKDLHVLGEGGHKAVKGISLTLREGEILGIVGVSGNGQKEFVETITGLRKAMKGKVLIFGKDATNRSPREIIDMGLSHIPDERRRIGISEGMTAGENFLIRDHEISPFSKRGFLNHALINEHVKKLVSEFQVLVPDLWTTETRILSGGNIQRLILARETWRVPRLIVAVHPTYGLDLKAVKTTHELFLNLKKKGTAILLVCEDLDEVCCLSDRVATIFNGKIVGISPIDKINIKQISLMMGGGTCVCQD